MSRKQKPRITISILNLFLIASAVAPFFASQYLNPDQLDYLQKGTFVCIALFGLELFYNRIEKNRHFRIANSDVQKISRT